MPKKYIYLIYCIWKIGDIIVKIIPMNSSPSLRTEIKETQLHQLGGPLLSHAPDSWSGITAILKFGFIIFSFKNSRSSYMKVSLKYIFYFAFLLM